MLVAVLLASSCAARRETVPPVAEDQQKSEEKKAFSLPPVDEEKEAAKAAKGKRDAQAILAQMDKDEEYLILNFENTDIKTIVSTFAELLEFNYILAPGVGGSVTIQSYKRIPIKDLFQIFQSILEINGLTAVQVGKFYHIIPIDQARTYPLDVETSREVDFTLDGSFITQLIPLEHVSAADVANNIIRQLMPRGVHLIVYEPANTLVLTARPETLAKFMRIIEVIDVTEGERHTQKTFVYYVENGSAKKLQDILKTIYVNKSTAKKAAPARVTPATRARPTVTRRPAASPASLPADLGEITITAYEDINALIIKASPRSYLGLLEVLKKIDVPPKQVLIDVMIAEISLSDSMQYRFEWFLQSQSGTLAGFNLGGRGGTGTPPSPLTLPPNVPNPATGFFSYAAAGTMGSSDFNALFTALETYSNVNVLASPSILAMDNKKAEIKIGSEEPVATRRTTGTSGTDLDIQYKTIGTLLSVTPHITEKGRVSMEISVEQSGIGEEQLVGDQKYPSFTTRTAKTTAVIEDGKTLVLGGIIYERGGSSRSGIPFLSRIPIIGALFGTHSYFKDKAELIIMVTPHVISNSEDALELTRQYQNRVKTIKEKIDFLRFGDNKSLDEDDDDKKDPKDKKDDEEDGEDQDESGDESEETSEQ